MIEDRNGLALCMWKMGIQPEGHNWYPMLILGSNGNLGLIMTEMPPFIHDAKEAVCKVFGMTNPLEVFVDRPTGFMALKDLLQQLKPTNFFSSRYIPRSALMPSRTDNKVCLSLELVGESLYIGVVIELTHCAKGKVCSDPTRISSIMSLVDLLVQEYCSSQKRAALAALIYTLSPLLQKVEVESLDL